MVYPRSASVKNGVIHRAHDGHECDAVASHDTLKSKYNAHPCHVDKQGWVDVDLPITVALVDLIDRRMCWEDEDSSLLLLLEEEGS